MPMGPSQWPVDIPSKALSSYRTPAHTTCSTSKLGSRASIVLVPKPSVRCSCTNPVYRNSTSAEAPALGPHAGYEVQSGSLAAAAASLPTAEYQDERHGIPSTSGPAGPRDTSAYQELGHRQSWTSRGSRATHSNYHLQHQRQQHRHRQQQQHWEQDSGGFSYLPLDPLADAGSWLHQSEYLPPLEPMETQHVQQQENEKSEDGESSSATDGSHRSNSSSSTWDSWPPGLEYCLWQPANQ